jgi:soluble cytochrome b562
MLVIAEKNILKGLGLESAMRTLVAVIVLAVSAQAISLKEFNAKTSSEQSAFVAGFVDKMTTDLRAKNPQLAQDMRNWFAVKPEGKPTSEGMERLYVELTAIELQAKEGKADLSKIQLESVIVWVAKQKFPPQPR